ncbi:hypothetical protein E2C01_035809 [Portunus trituberculatus]|uniref:Uncharacterized protein n=1 Tax=Portunus trituberculatus TaxID=210409 RepID=A0A5B7FCG6_PORTR|nr:hypothetical protein [Portunus trituberculatus]
MQLYAEITSRKSSHNDLSFVNDPHQPDLRWGQWLPQYCSKKAPRKTRPGAPWSGVEPQLNANNGSALATPLPLAQTRVTRSLSWERFLLHGSCGIIGPM